MKRLTGTLAISLVLLAPAYGYIRSTFAYGDGSVAFIKRSDASAVQFYINSSIVSGLTSTASGSAVTVISSGSNPVLAIRSAAAQWNMVSTSVARFIALKSTTKLIDPTDGQDTVAVGSTTGDLSVLGGKTGAVAVTINTAVGFAAGSAPTGDLTDSDIIINPSYAFSTDGSTTTDLQATMTHEFGHSLGLNHSGLLGATMFQYSELSERYLSSDEIAFATAVYPSKTAALGTIKGNVSAVDGSAVKSALVELIDTANGNALSALTAADGSYSVQGPAGSYVVYAEPLTGVVQAGNLYLLTTTTVTTNFQPTILGGTSPTQIAVSAGNTATVPTITVTAGTSSLTAPFAAIGKAGGSGDIRNVTSVTPYVIPSGQSVDIGLIGGGIDGTVSITAIGQGISVHVGSVHVDPGVSFGGSLAGQPMVRATLDIAAVKVPTLATVFVTKGTNALSMSGVLVLVPPTPTFTSNAVVNAASYKGAGVVSPGELASIYDSTGNSLGPNPFVQNTSFDLYGNLPTNAGGVSVTFDGILAPLYLAYAGQLNVQVPFEVTGKTSTQVVVNYYGSQSAPVTLSVVPAQPAFFTATPAASDSIIQNFPDNSLNSASNPIARGGYVTIYGTGIGMPYALATGQPGIVPPSSYTSASSSCSFGGQMSTAYAYWVFGLVGEASWTVPVPAATSTGPVVLTCTDPVSGASTQPGTVYVK